MCPDRPSVVRLMLPCASGLDARALAAAIVRAANSHVTWTELDGHGYGVLDVTTQRCRMDWYHLADRTRANTTARWVTGWSVGAGSSKIRRESAPT